MFRKYPGTFYNQQLCDWSNCVLLRALLVHRAAGAFALAMKRSLVCINTPATYWAHEQFPEQQSPSWSLPYLYGIFSCGTQCCQGVILQVVAAQTHKTCSIRYQLRAT